MTSSKSSLLSTSSRSNIFRKSFAILLIFAIILKDVNRVVSDSPASLVFPALASAAVAAAVSGDRDDDMTRASAEGPDGGTGAAPLLLNLVNPCGEYLKEKDAYFVIKTYTFLKLLFLPQSFFHNHYDLEEEGEEKERIQHQSQVRCTFNSRSPSRGREREREES